MESQAPSKTSPEIGDAESTMRRNLGLDGPSPASSPNDPLKMARQAIRSQVTAREYTERQLDQAQGTIQDLRGKLRHFHQEREAAVNASQSAMVARDAAERKMRAAESALATERSARVRSEGMLRDAEATIRALREKLATANQNLHTMQAELSAERLLGQKAGDGMIVVPETMVPTIREDGSPVVRRPVGRPRKIAAAQPVRATITPSEAPLAIVSPNVDAAGAIVKRPVGRPRKTVVVEPIQMLERQSRKLKASSRVTTPFAGKTTLKDRQRAHDDQEPVQWWVEGWRGR
jgi:hypothetical protein